jgi:hypothetical protein
MIIVACTPSEGKLIEHDPTEAVGEAESWLVEIGCGIHWASGDEHVAVG